MELLLNKYDYERKEVTVEDLHICMGKQLDEIGEILFPNLSSEVRKNLMHECCTLENEYLGEHGGKLYLKVEETNSINSGLVYGIEVLGQVPEQMRHPLSN